MKSKLKILEAERIDLPEVVELWQELMNFHKDLDSFFSCSEDGSIRFMDHISKQIELENATILVAKKAGSVIGYS